MQTIDYQKQAQDFLDQTSVSFHAEFVKHGKHFDDDKSDRDIYKITLTRGARSFVFNFGQSINASGKWLKYGHHKAGVSNTKNKPTPSYEWDKNKDQSVPTAYDVLTCLEKHEVGTFEDFCLNYGYDTDSRRAEKTYHAVLEEYKNVKMIWSDEEIEKLQEIQ